jgi:hypothetical protein
VAILLGCKKGTKVSRYERFARKPSLETLFAYEVVFGAPAREPASPVSEPGKNSFSRSSDQPVCPMAGVYLFP